MGVVALVAGDQCLAFDAFTHGWSRWSAPESSMQASSFQYSLPSWCVHSDALTGHCVRLRDLALTGHSWSIRRAAILPSWKPAPTCSAGHRRPARSTRAGGRSAQQDPRAGRGGRSFRHSRPAHGDDGRHRKGGRGRARDGVPAISRHLVDSRRAAGRARTNIARAADARRSAVGSRRAIGYRLAAFYAAMIELLDAHADLVLGTETGGARFATGAYGFWSAHVRSLLVDAGIADPDGLVDTLLAPVSAEVYIHQRARGLTSAQITDALVTRRPWGARRHPLAVSGAPSGEASNTVMG